MVAVAAVGALAALVVVVAKVFGLFLEPPAATAMMTISTTGAIPHAHPLL